MVILVRNKRLYADPGFWLLIAVNIYLTWRYYQQPEIFTTLIWLYWSQSVLLGLFNFADMITTKASISLPENATYFEGNISGESSSTDGVRNKTFPSGIVANFFLFHYGFFHLVYFIFLFGMKKTGPIDWALFKYFFAAFFIGQVITFIQHKIAQRKNGSNIGKMFFLPYLRIIPMHLTILIPAFMNISDLGIFLVLKAIADVLMYAVTKPAYNGKETDQAMLASQQITNV